MKRPVAVILAIAIVGAVAFCFLRPLPGDVPFIVEGRSDTVYTFTEPQPFELSGKDAERIEAVYTETFSRGAYTSMGITFRSTDDRCYTFGSTLYTHGEGTGDPEHNSYFTEKYENGKWCACENGSMPMWGGYLIGRANYVTWAFSSTEEMLPYNIPLNIDEPGRYRITFCFRDYIPSSSEDMRSAGSSGEGLYEASFEYDVPGRSLFSAKPRVGSFTMQDTSAHYDTCAELDMVLTNWRIGFGYLQEDGSGIMRRTDSGEYVPDDTVVIAYGFSENNFLLSSEEKRDYYVRPLAVSLLYWEYGAEYRLTLVFTENEDGTGEKCSVTLNLRFDE